VWSLSFAPDGKHLASAGADKVVRLWDSEAGTQLHCFVGHEKIVTRALFLYEGRCLVSGSFDGTVRFWPLGVLLDGTGSPYASATTTTSASAGVLVRQGIAAAVTAVAIADDCVNMAVGTVDGYAAVWDPWTGERRARFLAHTKGPVTRLAYTPGKSEFLLSTGTDSTIKLWSARRQNTLVRTITCPGQRVTFVGVHFLSDESGLVATREGAIVHLNIADGSLIATFQDRKAHTPITCVAATADDRAVIAGSVDGKLRLWPIHDLPNAAKPQSIRVHDAPVTDIVVGPCKSYVATSSEDGTVALWSVPSRAYETHKHELKAWKRVTSAVLSSPPRRMSFFAGETIVLVGCEDGTTQLLHAATGRRVDAFQGHKAAVTAVATSPVGTLIATGSHDGTVKLWNPPGFAILQALQGHVLPVSCISVAPQCSFVATGSQDTTVRVWRLSDDSPLAPFSTRYPLRSHRASVTALTLDEGTGSLTSRAADKSTAVWELHSGRRLSEGVAQVEAAANAAAAAFQVKAATQPGQRG
jgi:WD40 repeat protein